MMTFKTKYKLITIKSVIHVLFVLIFGYIIYDSNPFFPYYFAYYVRNSLYLILAGITLFYIHSLVLLPLKSIKNRNEQYYLFLLCCVLLFLIFNYELKAFSLRLTTETFRFVGIIFSILVSSYIYWYILKKLNDTETEQLLRVEVESKTTELELLKSQVNPHFLFNTLNTVYATALKEKADKTAESTAKLANLIRYMQNDINKDFILLKNEIDYLKDYIIIQKLRCAVEPEIKTTFENVTDKVISPGLLIPFVENAFKYGIDPTKKSDLEISIICDNYTIKFNCINSYSENYKINKKEEGFGIGISNAKQRLALVYPNQHTLEIEKENNTFSVELTITTKQ